MPELDASRLRAPAMGCLEPKRVRLEIVDERFVSAADKQKSIDNVRIAVSGALARAGVMVSPDAANKVSLRFGEPDLPIGAFSTNECLIINAALMTAASPRIQATGYGCARHENLYGYSLRADTTTAFETAINMALSEMVRGCAQTAGIALSQGRRRS